MRISLKFNPAKFHPDAIRNDGALGFFEGITQQSEEQDEQR